MASSAGEARFWAVAESFIAGGLAERGTIMGGPCLRAGQEFLAMPGFKAEGMVLKLPAQRVTALITDGIGLPFAPNGRVFKEWVHIAEYDEPLWRSLLEEGRAFATR
jgi:hypothetical protein